MKHLEELGIIGAVKDNPHQSSTPLEPLPQPEFWVSPLLGNLIELKHLNLNNLPITTLPSTLKNLKKLRGIYLTNTGLPEGFRKYFGTSQDPKVKYFFENFPFTIYQEETNDAQGNTLLEGAKNFVSEIFNAFRFIG